MAVVAKDGGEENKIRGKETSYSVVTGIHVRDNNNVNQRCSSESRE